MTEMNVVRFPPHERSEIEQAGDDLRRDEHAIVHNKTVIARIWRANYLALRAAGFSRREALELCWRA
jgi:hypothetical protein